MTWMTLAEVSVKALSAVSSMLSIGKSLRETPPASETTVEATTTELEVQRTDPPPQAPTVIIYGNGNTTIVFGDSSSSKTG